MLANPAMKNRSLPYSLIAAGLILLLSACGGGDTASPGDENADVQTRSFYMGFTPWPYDASLEAVNTTYRKIQDHGDMVGHQIMQGIPWAEAFANTGYPAAVEADLDLRLNSMRSGKTLFLAIDSLDASRRSLANNWGTNGEEPRPAPWDSRNFNDPEVITAYSNFALDLIARFKPEYFNYASEVSELILNDPAQYDSFKIFARQVYGNIKAKYPDLKLMVSVALKSPASSEMAQVKSRLADILDYVDEIGVSVYPYIFYNHTNKGDPDTLPADWLNQINRIAPGKPVAITETGWIAEDLVISGYGVNVASNPLFQKKYVARLLQEAQKLDVEFVIWWSLIDYQALWDGALRQDDVAAIWRDIGLYDEALQPRPGLSDWQDYLARTKDQ